MANAPLALTMGEPAGIGGEISAMAWLRRDAEAVPPFVLIDDPKRVAKIAAKIGLDIPIAEIDAPEEAENAFGRALPILAVADGLDYVPGKIVPEAAKATIKSIDDAVALTQAGRTCAVVTNPIQKDALYAAGFEHPGHTEYLAAKAGPGVVPVMLLACDAIKVVPVTIHLALREAIEALTEDMIVETGRITIESLRGDFGIERPVLAVAGLNPHAGENGHMGREEIDMIGPAIERLREWAGDSAVLRGPLAPDTLFHAGARKTYDAALCMYHDQALIPIKTIDFDGGVNVTVGLPFVRTSPDHGTALDIAGTGTANPHSLIQSLKLARRIAETRRRLGAARRT